MATPNRLAFPLLDFIFQYLWDTKQLNPATEMLIQRKGEKRVINKQTFQFIKNDGWEEVVETPSELLNK